MKFTASLSDFHKELQKTLPAMPRKSTLPILEHLFFILKGNELKIIATDQDIIIMSAMQVMGEEDGSVLVPGRRIKDIVQALNNVQTIEFSTKENSYDIVIKTQTGKYGMKGLDPDEYLALPELFQSEKPQINLEDGTFVPVAGKTPTAFFKKEDIIRLTEKTVFAVSTEEYRPAMTGVYFQLRGNYVNAVATDSFRLSKVVVRSEKEIFPNDLNVIIPSRAADLMKKADNDVLMSFIKTMDKITHVRFDIGETVIITRIIDEKFPPYETVIPPEYRSLAVIPYNEALASIRRASIFTSSVSRQIKLVLSEDTLSVIGEDEDTGSSANEVITCDYKGEEFSIGFNHVFLEQAIANLGTETDNQNFTITFSEPNRPVLIRPNLESDDLLMLIMPVRLT